MVDSDRAPDPARTSPRRLRRMRFDAAGPALRRRPRGALDARFHRGSSRPATKVFVTVDSGEADIDDAEIIAPLDLPAAIAARRFGTIVKSPGVSRYRPIFAHGARGRDRGDLEPQPLGRDVSRRPHRHRHHRHQGQVDHRDAGPSDADRVRARCGARRQCRARAARDRRQAQDRGVRAELVPDRRHGVLARHRGDHQPHARAHRLAPRRSSTTMPTSSTSSTATRPSRSALGARRA